MVLDLHHIPGGNYFWKASPVASYSATLQSYSIELLKAVRSFSNHDFTATIAQVTHTTRIKETCFTATLTSGTYGILNCFHNLGIYIA